jgi:hypothetical protein
LARNSRSSNGARELDQGSLRHGPGGPGLPRRAGGGGGEQDRAGDRVLGPEQGRGHAPGGLRLRPLHHGHHVLPRRLRPRPVPPRPVRPPPRRPRRRHQALPVQGRPGVALRRRLRLGLLAPVRAGGARPLRPPLERLLRRPQAGRPPPLRRRVAGRRGPLPGARHGGGPLRRAGAGARQAQHPRRAREAAAPDGDAAVRVPAGGVPEARGGHGDLRAGPRQDLRRPRLRGVLAPAVGRVDGGVSGDEVLRRDDGVGDDARVGAPQERLLRRRAVGAEGRQLRGVHDLGPLLRQAHQLHKHRQVLRLIWSFSFSLICPVHPSIQSSCTVLVCSYVLLSYVCVQERIK